MGQIHERRVELVRSYIDPLNPTPVPELDYDLIYPISVFDAVKKNMETDAPSLSDELRAIYELIESKQGTIDGGIAGQLMTWSGEDGVIGSTEIVRTIANDPDARSHTKIPSEKAVGQKLDLKADASSFNSHISDLNIHITEDERSEWSSMTPIETFNEHSNNTDIHVTAEDKINWNGKADETVVTAHLNDSDNPHNVTAHQVGTYSRSEVDGMFDSIRTSFFNYKNIYYDERTSTAELVEYDEENYNPSYVLSYSDPLPEVTDTSLTYFAIIPVTDYSSHESNEILIYIKKPDSPWTEVGSQNLEAGDLVVRKTDSAMCAWLDGRFVVLMSGAVSGEGSELLWRPRISEEGIITFTRSTEVSPPDPVNIKGPAGYTPIKGVDYFDGAPGLGIPEGGVKNDVMIKSSAADYDTAWKSINDIIGEIIDEGELPISVKWSTVKEKPEMHHELGDDDEGFISQKAVSDEINTLNDTVDGIKEIIEGSGGTGGIIDTLNSHINNFNNPHMVTPDSIGAVSTSVFESHTESTENPHHVTAEQVGLGNVNNTADIDKPLSIAMQAAVDTINDEIDEINRIIGSGNLIMNVEWDGMTCTLTFTFRNGEKLDVVIPIMDIFENLYFDETTKEFVFVLPDGSEKRISVQSLVTVYVGSVSTNAKTEVNGDTITVTVLEDSLTGNELVADISLRGNPTTTTQDADDNSTKIATTEFVKGQVVDSLDSTDATKSLSANMGKWLNDNKTSTEEVLELIAEHPSTPIIDNLESTDPNSALSANMGNYIKMTKAPTVHTSPNGAKFGRATEDLFGHARAAVIDPLMDGEVSLGTDDGYFARSDHRHPTDTSRAPLFFSDGVSLLGDPRSVTPADDADSNQIATCEWVLEHGGVDPDIFIVVDDESATSRVRSAYERAIADAS